MQTQVTFYILADENDSTLPASYFQACHMAAHYYRQNQRVFIYTADQTKAHDSGSRINSQYDLIFQTH